MTSLPAPIWNQIAATQALQTEAAKLAFAMDGTQIAEMEDEWYRLELEAGTPRRIVSSLMTCLPLLLENEAIANHLDRHPNLRSALPPISDVETAVTLMQAEWRLTAEEKATLTTALSSPEPLERWLTAVQKVSAMQSA